MNYQKVIINILDSFGVNHSYTGYDYVIHGLLLIIEDRACLECITKSLYLDVAEHFNTSWKCVEKNMRTIVNSVWNSHNTGLLDLIFNRPNRNKKPTNKEFLKNLYDYIMHTNTYIQMTGHHIPVICPISNKCCDSLSHFYFRLDRMAE